ncbi:rhodanese-like domain-containing protein [Candidatus Falkowbacteria bacterium]|nr:rhodanese-like domain-containing protein [Candidatus Falkowbacteria bacterium]
MKQIILVIMAIVVTGVGSSLGTAYFLKKDLASKESLVAAFYATENAVSVSPHGLRGKMDKGDTSFILVDLRSQEEYEKEHIIGAINIPAYKNKTKSAYDEVDRIVSSFKALPQDKEIIMYCYSIPCMTSRKVGDMLAKEGIYAKHLNIGWNEWRYFWNLWNHEHEWNATKAEDYIMKGKEPGTPQIRDYDYKCGDGELSC